MFFICLHPQTTITNQMPWTPHFQSKHFRRIEWDHLITSRVLQCQACTTNYIQHFVIATSANNPLICIVVGITFVHINFPYHRSDRSIEMPLKLALFCQWSSIYLCNHQTKLAHFYVCWLNFSPKASMWNISITVRCMTKFFRDRYRHVATNQT